jgi:hypothetical protein
MQVMERAEQHTVERVFWMRRKLLDLSLVSRDFRADRADKFGRKPSAVGRSTIGSGDRRGTKAVTAISPPEKKSQ